ncbi:GIY-YIG nuclease family protein [Anaerovorax sp. IOR16]|uniref:GIY-YIG nuclease family protein n=1 Tax=Anaerovorax sp. IOR16 TaxID=2773458 RepID=UPI0019D2B6BA
MEEKKHYVYILKCSNGSLYTGWTTDLQARIKAHNQGVGAKYTRSHRPVELVYYETFKSRSDALKREAQIKKLRRTEKLILLQK